MTTPARSARGALALASAALIAGCGTAAPAAHGHAPKASPSFLATSLVTPAGTWAVAVMGGSVASRNNFWQLFIRPAGSQRWKLVTPAGTADNGGLVLAAAGTSLITGFRPSQYLTYTPLTTTRDGGQAWSSTGPLDGALANRPDALAAAPATRRLIALLTDGTVKLAASGYTSWKTLTSKRSLAATPAGRRCRLQALTAASFTPSGTPLLGGACARPGTAGIFASPHGTWQAAGPVLPPALAGQDIAVLRLTRTPQQTVAILQAGRGPAASLLAAWSAGDGGHWTLSGPLPLRGAALISASFGPPAAVAIMLTGGRGESVTGATKQWQLLPALPPGTATLAFKPGAAISALAVHRGTLTLWQTAPGGASWTRAQTISVPIQYGSSG
jgi:hypothetical protein